MVCSRRHLGTFSEFTEKEVGLLAEMLKQVTSTYDKVFDVPVPVFHGLSSIPHRWQPAS